MLFRYFLIISIAGFLTSSCGLPIGEDGEKASDTSSAANNNNSDGAANDDSLKKDTGGQGTTYLVRIDGAVQKGPFVIGSTIAVSPLNADFSPQGTVYKTSTINNLGEFKIDFEASGPVAIEGLGFFYNEVTGSLSSANLTLRAFFVPRAGGDQRVYVNLITHLITERVKQLVSEGNGFDDAVWQAEQSLWQALDITTSEFSMYNDSIGMSVTGGNSDGNAYLLGVGSVLIQVAQNRNPGAADAELQSLLNEIAGDFQDGQLEDALKNEIYDSLNQINLDDIAMMLRDRLSRIQSEVALPDMHQVLDQDKDGIVNAFDNCIYNHNPGQEDSDADGTGDACADCPPNTHCGGNSYSECSDDSVCDTGSSCQFNSALCANGSGTCCIPSGNALEPCFSDSTCNAGYACMDNSFDSGFCPDYLSECCVSTQGEGGWCGDDYVCDDGMVCVDASTNASCDDRLGNCCITAGSGSAYCDSANPCGSGFACIDNSDGLHCSDSTLSSCCVATDGTSGQPCDEYNGCVDGECLYNDSSCPWGTSCCVSYGGKYEPCAVGRTCDDGLWCVYNEVDYFDQCMPVGNEGNPCDSAHPCSDGLACVNNGGGLACGNNGTGMCCVATDGTHAEACDFTSASCATGFECMYDDTVCSYQSECCIAVGGLDEPCNAYSNCESGLWCVWDNAAGKEFCRATGGEGNPCDWEHPCADSLVCVSNTNGAACGDNGFNECCVKTDGTQGQPCVDNSSCGAGYVCEDDDSVCAIAGSPCCQTAGGADQPCYADMSCDGDMRCIWENNTYRYFCRQTGGDHQPCRGDNSCDSGLMCVWDSSYDSGDVCLPFGGEGESCDDANAFHCNTGLICVSAGASSVCAANALDYCCIVPDGSALSACVPGACDIDLTCAIDATVCPSAFDPCCVAAGGEGEQCQEDHTCDAGLVCVWDPLYPEDGSTCKVGQQLNDICDDEFPCAAGLSCGATNYCVVTPTTEGADCTAAQECGPGLRCQYDVCALAGAPGQLCYDDYTCDSPHVCFEAEGESLCIETPGTCSPTEPCDTDHLCVQEPWGDNERYCIKAGDVGQPCWQPSATCTGTLNCVSDWVECAGYFGDHSCCLQVGGKDEPCLPDQTCNFGFGCVEDYYSAANCGTDIYQCCAEAGAENQPCNSDGTCDVGLVCSATGCETGLSITGCCLPGA